MRNVELSTASHGYARTIDAQRESDLQTALFGMVGHDLRQPLQVIQSSYDILRNSVRSTSEQAWLDRGERAIGRLTGQLDRMLETLRFFENSKALEISSVALAPLFWRLGHENEDAALRRGIDMRVCTTGMHVASHPVLLGSILRNLVTNAVKYTEPGGRILIGCRRSGPDVRIEVYDSGIGIAPDQLAKIFNAFERLDTARGDGLGLGLFVVRRALDALGHRIEVSSSVARGSRFSIIAPRSW